MSKPAPIIFASPLVCLALLGGIVAQNRTHLKPEDVEPYHARAKAAIEAWPRLINGWRGEDYKIDVSAEQLLHPNCVLNRRYIKERQGVGLLIVQCKDTRDMAGHYPPICYPAIGEHMTSAQEFNLPVSNPDGITTVRGMEYHFTKSTGLHIFERFVYDFFIVPGKGFVRDMPDVRQSAKDYQRRYLGAAQFQVVFDNEGPELSPTQREDVVKILLGANAQAFDILNTVARPDDTAMNDRAQEDPTDHLPGS